jgi:PAS domain S-box-containing protein
MTLEHFEWIAEALPEPMMLVTVRGRVMAANRALRQILGTGFVVGRQYDVSEIFRTPREQIREYLRLCSAVRHFLPGSLKLHFYSEPEQDLRCEGVGVESSNFPEQIILLRLKAKTAAGERFRTLNEQIDALNSEIGKRIKAEEANRWMLAVMESSEDAIISKDLNGIIISCNQGASQLFGYGPEELIGKAMKLLIPSGHEDEENKILARMRLGEKIEHFETVRRRKDGSLVEVSLTISPVKDPLGKIIGVSNIARDMTQRRQNEEIMRRQASMFDQAYDAIFVWQWKGPITFWNRGAERMYGFSRTEAIGQVSHKLLNTQTSRGMPTLLAELESQGQWEGELDHVTHEGPNIHVETRMVLVREKTRAYVLEVNRDITARKHVQQQLEESFRREKAARETAENANLAKDDFLASLSHELRTPLNPVLLIASDAAENPDLPPEIRDNFETIRKNIELEARLIDDLLDLTRITHGKLSLHFHEADARTILQEAIANVQSEVNAKQIQISVIWSAVHSTVYCDEVRVQQVFWNVLKNAVKFTPPNGKITIEATATNGRLSARFTDTGIGMTQEEIERIFDAFAQGDHIGNGTHRFGGLGLGLAISRRLVEMHLGRIYASSDGRDKGSTFIIELPLAKEETINSTLNDHSGSETVLFQPERSVRILLVEDHEPTRITLAHLLTRRQYKVLAARNATEARDISAREKVDLVISDVGLPDGNGNELMKELWERFGLKGIALTGYGMEQDVEHSLASGFVTHLIKPVNVRSLEKALEEFKFHDCGRPASALP